MARLPPITGKDQVAEADRATFEGLIVAAGARSRGRSRCF